MLSVCLHSLIVFMWLGLRLRTLPGNGSGCEAGSREGPEDVLGPWRARSGRNLWRVLKGV